MIIAEKYDADYIVRESGDSLNFPKKYEDEYYMVYEIIR